MQLEKNFVEYQRLKSLGQPTTNKWVYCHLSTGKILKFFHFFMKYYFMVIETQRLGVWVKLCLFYKERRTYF